jgi:thioredoxin 1
LHPVEKTGILNVGTKQRAFLWGMPERKKKMANVLHFTQGGFDQAMTQKGVVLVDFWATWCGPCKMLAPTIEELAVEYDGRVTVGKVDVDEEMSLATRFGIMSIPTVMVFVDGVEQGKLVGVRPKAELAALLDSVL